MRVAVIPAALVAHPHRVVVVPVDHRLVLHRIDHRGAESNHYTAGSGDDIHQTFGSPDIETGVVIDTARANTLPVIDVRRLVSHLGPGGEPTLTHRVNERTGRHEGRPGRPKTQAGVFYERPVVGVAVLVIGFGYG